MPSNFSPNFYESIFEASVRGELWEIEKSDLTPLEIHLMILITAIYKLKTIDAFSPGKVISFGIAAKILLLKIFLFF